MTKAVVPLASTYAPNKRPARGFLSEKLDGIPIKFVMTPLGLETCTRPGKPVGRSIDHIREEMSDIMRPNQTIVMEVFEPGIPFKVSGGKVRKDEPCPNLIGGIFDVWQGDEGYNYPLVERFAQAQDMLQGLKTAFMIKQYEFDSDTVMGMLMKTVQANAIQQDALWEGFVIRDAMGASVPNSRSNGYWRVTEDPTVDLWAVGVYEAFDKFGESKGIAGGLVVERNGQLEKISAGKLTHAERKVLWDERGIPDRLPVMNTHNAFVWFTFNKQSKRMMQAKFKRDPSYALLRQATFQVWRDDKDEPSED